MEKCFDCKKENATGKGEDISFLFKGKVNVTVFKIGGQCRECAIKEFERSFKEYGSGWIDFDGSVIEINWKLYFSKNEEFNDRFHANMDRLLLNFSLLSFSRKGNWIIVDASGICLNPSNMMPLFFTREKDVREYARLKYSNTMYDWEIIHIDRAISKNQA